ncbi:chaplin [Streptomyces sp. NPDC055287]
MALPVSSALAADGAGADATTAGSPGLLSGNAIQVPVDVPVNICGNTVNVVGLLNPAAGNTCANKGGGAAKDGSSKESGSKESGSENYVGSAASGGASAQGLTADSPGLISGNGIQLPVDLPVNVSGNSVNVVGLGNPVFGNESVNGPGDQPRQHSNDPAPKPRASKPPAPKPSNDPAPKPRVSTAPVLVPSQHTPDAAAPMLAHTGGDLTAPAIAGSAALLAGAVLYRRFRPVRTR